MAKNGKVIQLPNEPLRWTQHLLPGERADVQSLIRVMNSTDPKVLPETRGIATCAVGMAKALCLLRERVKHTFDECNTDEALNELLLIITKKKTTQAEAVISRIVMDTRQSAAKLALNTALDQPTLLVPTSTAKWEEDVDRVVNAFKYEDENNDNPG